MEKEFSGNTIPIPSSSSSAAAEVAWNLSNFGGGMEIETNNNNIDVNNCGPESLSNCFFSPNWDDNSVDHHQQQQNDLFESALSSIVSSPVASGAGENIVLRELIGRLGSICNSAGGGNSTNTSCYTTPLNSPPKHQTLFMENYQNQNHNQQIRGYFPIPPTTQCQGVDQLPSHSSLGPLSSDPNLGRFSCFASSNLGSPNPQFGHTTSSESEFPFTRMDYYNSSNLPRISTITNNKSGTGVGVGVGVGSVDEKKLRRFSRSPENGEEMESSVSEQIQPVHANANANARKRKAIPRGGGGKSKEKAAGIGDESNANTKKIKSDDDGDEEKVTTSAKEKIQQNGSGKAGTEKGNQKQSKETNAAAEAPKDYIHVRARRGQATDSHSLAERVRREKISERMKFLQDLVPGCNKVTGKAVMLDEIINYVQSLQRQVEFLSMKLATVTPKMDFNMEALLSKDMFQSRGSLARNNHHSIYQLETPFSQSQSTSLSYGYHNHNQSQQQFPFLSSNNNNGITEAAAAAPFFMNNTNSSLLRPRNPHPPMDAYAEAAASQVSTFLEDELHNVVHMGFGQNQQPQSFPGNITQMKIEL